MKRLCVLSICLLATLVASAQELRCTVTINADKIQGTNKSAYETLKQTLEETINTTRWTNMTFAEKERIECSMMIVVNSVDNNIYHCEMQLQSRRPVYNTGYQWSIAWITTSTIVRCSCRAAALSITQGITPPC